MQLGEIVFGGVGSGLYGMIVFVVLTVFIAGLMVGRTPEYLGKKIERREVQFAILAALVTPVLCLVPTAIAAVMPAGTGDAQQRRPARLLRDPLRVHVDQREQRLRVRRSRAEPVLQLADRHQHDVRPLRVIMPALALAGALAGKKAVPEGAGTFTTHSADLRRAADRRDRHRRRADVFAGRRARPDRRTPAHPARKDVLMLSQRRLDRRPKARSLFDRAIVARAVADSFKKLDPRWQARNPGHVRRRGRRGGDDHLLRARPRESQRRARASTSRSRRGCGSRCSSRTSPKRWPKGAERRKPSPCAARSPTRTRASCTPTGPRSASRARSLRKGDRFVVEAGEIIPADGEVIEGAATVDESAITGESAPVIREVRRRSQRGDRRHARALRPDRRAHHGQPRRELSRPHDRARRRRAAAEDAERDRALDPARRPDDHLLIAVATLSPFSIYAGAHQSVTVLIALLVCLIPDDDRRLAVGDRHRRHGPRHAAQRARDERARRRSGRRRRHAAARQDRHDHARQSPGDRDHRRPRASTRATRRASRYLSSLADETPEGPFDRRAGAEQRGGNRRDGASSEGSARSCRSAPTRA